MKNQNNINVTEKRAYITPKLEVIVLDNEISLILATGDSFNTIDFGDPGSGCAAPENKENFNNNPY